MINEFIKMKKTSITLLSVILPILLISCDDGPPILPGLTKSQVVVSTNPEGATITINGKVFEKTTPTYIDELEPGFYKIDVKKSTYLDTTFYIIFQRGRTDTINTLMREDPTHWWKVWKTSNGLPSGAINDLVFDNSGSLWIATNGGGLAKFNNTTFQIYTSSNSQIPSNFLRKIFFDKSNNLWVASSLGIAKFDGAVWTKFSGSNANLVDNYITSIVEDKNNVIWFGTASGGLISFDGVRFNSYTMRNSGLPSNYITSIVVDANNNKWIGTYGEGLVKFDNYNWQVFHVINSNLYNNYINDLFFDRQGNLWIASGASSAPVPVGTLTKFDGTNFRHYLGRGFTTVNKISESPNGAIWIGTTTGLFSYFSENWALYTLQNSGLPNNSVTSITFDAEGNKWVGGSSGLSKYIGGN